MTFDLMMVLQCENSAKEIVCTGEVFNLIYFLNSRKINSENIIK